MATSAPGPRPPTIADVARLAGVSRTTVSHALNGLGKVDPRTRERVRQAAAELGYRPNLRAQRLRRGQAKAIALENQIQKNSRFCDRLTHSFRAGQASARAFV